MFELLRNSVGTQKKIPKLRNEREKLIQTRGNKFENTNPTILENFKSITLTKNTPNKHLKQQHEQIKKNNNNIRKRQINHVDSKHTQNNNIRKRQINHVHPTNTQNNNSNTRTNKKK